MIKKSLIIAIGITLFLYLTAAVTAGEGYRNFNVKEEWLVKKVNIDEVEHAVTEIKEEVDKQDPETPYSLDELRWFTEQIIEGDEIWYFDTPQEMWVSLSGANGYALMRNGKQVCALVLTVS